MNFAVVGTNHKHSPIEIREKLFLSKSRLRDVLLLLRERRVLKGAVCLSTCNRMEIYASAKDSKIAISEIETVISQYHRINKGEFSPYLYIYEGEEAVAHLFSVASGLDSLILGETQILGQVNFAFSESMNIGFVDELSKIIFYSAESAAKRIHRETKISAGGVSAGSVAVDFIKEKIASLAGKSILIIGTGKVAGLLLRYLKEEKPDVVFISNRAFEKARGLAAQIGAKAVRFDELKLFIKKADVVIAAAASPHYIIKKDILDEAIGQKLIILDLALPRNVDPRVGELENVELFYLENLESVIKKNTRIKVWEAEKAGKIIDKEAEILWTKHIESEREPALLR